MGPENSETNDLLVTLNDYLSRLIPAVKECANHYQSGRLNEGSNLLVNMIEGLNWVIGAVASVHIQGVNVKEINMRLNEIVKAFENEDYILVGDLLEYEIAPAMQELFDKADLLITKGNH